MAYEYIPTDVTEALRGDYKAALFFRVGFENPLRLAFGFSDIPLGIESIDPNGVVYKAAGQLQDLPEIEVLFNGMAEEVSFTISGLSPEHGNLIIESAPPVVGAPAHLGFAPLDERYQPLSQIVSKWTGIADYLIDDYSPGEDIRSPPVRSITLVCMSGESARTKQSLKTYTDAAQRTISSDDKFCERVAKYVQRYMPDWPRY